MRRFVFAFALLTPMSLLGSIASADAGYFSLQSTTSGPGEITVHWDWTEPFSGPPIDHPEWVGYDVFRRDVTACNVDWVRLNAEIVPRTVGVSHSREFVDTTPVNEVMYEYTVHMVDASRNQVLLDLSSCEWPCFGYGWSVTPALSAPVVVGTLTDWGWAMYVTGCAEYCDASFYFEGPLVQSARDQGLVGRDVKVFGVAGCCSVEGPSIIADHLELAACGVVPVRRSSWGGVKTLYR
jgi:hypothetical protein